jgi:hypothetical protein
MQGFLLAGCLLGSQSDRLASFWVSSCICVEIMADGTVHRQQVPVAGGSPLIIIPSITSTLS